MSPDPMTHWSDRGWSERSDTNWARGGRLLQGRWREEALGLPAGPISRARPERLVVSMLPCDTDERANFLDERSYQAAQARPGSRAEQHPQWQFPRRDADRKGRYRHRRVPLREARYERQDDA